MFLVHCLFFLLCAVTSLLVKCHHAHTHVHATHVQALSCCVVFCLHLVCSLNVYHPCHTHHYSWSSLYITCTIVPVLHVTFVHTYTVLCYMSAMFSTYYLSVSTIQHIHQAYMYMLHTYIHLLSVVCYITTNKKGDPWCKRFTSISHAHGEALLCATSTVFNSYH